MYRRVSIAESVTTTLLSQGGLKEVSPRLLFSPSSTVTTTLLSQGGLKAKVTFWQEDFEVVTTTLLSQGGLKALIFPTIVFRFFCDNNPPITGWVESPERSYRITGRYVTTTLLSQGGLKEQQSALCQFR